MKEKSEINKKFIILFNSKQNIFKLRGQGGAVVSVLEFGAEVPSSSPG